jgi:Tfp pilus assembly protein PilF
LVHWQTNRLDLAVDLIASAIRCNPHNHEYFLNLGELLREQNKLDEARKSFDIAIKLAPDRAAPWIKLGNLLRIQRRYDEVLLSYEHAFTLDPGNAEAPALSGGVLFELGRHEEALFRWPFPRIRLKRSVSKAIACSISPGPQRPRPAIGGPPSWSRTVSRSGGCLEKCSSNSGIVTARSRRCAGRVNWILPIRSARASN